MSANAIPVEAREEALRTIARFNQKVLAQSGCCYVPRFKGKYLYLDREDFGKVGPICRWLISLHPEVQILAWVENENEAVPLLDRSSGGRPFEGEHTR